MTETEKEINDFFDKHQQKGLDELQKFFDSGGKLDFSEIKSTDEISEIIKNSISKNTNKKLTLKDGVFKWE